MSNRRMHLASVHTCLFARHRMSREVSNAWVNTNELLPLRVSDGSTDRRQMLALFPRSFPTLRVRSYRIEASFYACKYGRIYELFTELSRDEISFPSERKCLMREERLTLLSVYP